MELRHLRYFVAVAEELHFGRAARRLNISQPPLSQQIRALEAELDVELFARAGRRVELTHAGRMFLERARQALAGAEDAMQAARRAGRGEIGGLSIAFIHAATYRLLPDILRVFRARMPNVELSLIEMPGSEQMLALNDGAIDVGFLRPPIANAALDVHLLLREPLVVGLPPRHRYARLDEVTLRQLADEPFVMYTPGRSPLYGQVVSACSRAGFVPRVVQHSMHIMTLIGLVRSGVGIALLPQSASAVRMDGIVYRKLRYVGPRTETVVAARRGDHGPITRAFVEVCRETSRAT